MGAGPLILIPPSEGKATGGSGDPWQPGTSRFATLDDPRQRVVKALLRAMRGSAVRRGALLGVKGGALAAATAANRSVREAPTMAAIERYTGVLYAELDPATLPRRSLTRARDQVVVVSGMWGLGAPFDPIPDYKLAMGSSLEGLGRLSTWWRPHVTHALAEVAGGRTVWDLLPNEHAAAWAPDAASLDARVRVRFLDRSVGADGEERLVAVSHWNKLLKGALVRHLLATQLDDPAGLIHFDHPLGYRYDPARTETHGTQVTVSLLRET